MKVVIRADASLDIGTGHIMRCITLATELKARGDLVVFICRLHVGNLVDFIQMQGFKVFSLPIDDEFEDCFSQGSESQIYHSSWLGATQRKDAQECMQVLENIHPDWLIVDHYSIDEFWEQELRKYYTKLLVIDDLADRIHQCDLLLDQTFGRNSSDYTSLVPEGCQLLLGSRYALLRPEFAQWRGKCLASRANSGVHRLLITMGGVDQGNVTCQIMDALKECDLPKGVEVLVVLGATAPHLEVVRKQAKGMSCKTEVLVGVSNMAEIMSSFDLAIGAAGATTWERCCLGLPSILIVLAKNQKKIADLILDAKCAVVLDLHEIDSLPKAIRFARSNLSDLSVRSASVTDGQGVRKLVEYIV